jgi:hypothetical protein
MRCVSHFTCCKHSPVTLIVIRGVFLTLFKPDDCIQRKVIVYSSGSQPEVATHIRVAGQGGGV